MVVKASNQFSEGCGLSPCLTGNHKLSYSCLQGDRGGKGDTGAPGSAGAIGQTGPPGEPGPLGKKGEPVSIIELVADSSNTRTILNSKEPKK